MERLAALRVKFKKITKGILGVPPEKDLIWGMIDNWQGTQRQVLAGLLFLVMFMAFGFSPIRSVILLLSMLLHEMGHALVLHLRGIGYQILFLWPLGAAAAPINPEENARSDQLPLNDQAWFVQLGPLVNVGLMGLGIIIQYLPLTSMPWLAVIGRELVYVNGVLAIFNLPAVWILDGGMIYRIIFVSVPVAWRSVVTLIVANVCLITMFILLLPYFKSTSAFLAGILLEGGAIIFFALFFAGASFCQRRAKLPATHQPQLLSVRQVAIQMLIHTFAVLSVFALLKISPWS